jgi:MFS family permease
MAATREQPMQATEIETGEASPRYRGWRVVVLCFVMAIFAWGFGFYGHGVYLAELRREHGWPVGVIAGASTVYYLCSAIMVAFVGDALARLGPLRLVLGGIACLAASTLSLPHVAAPWQLYLAYLPMSLGWAALSLGAITNVLGLWFRARRGLAISLALNGASLSGVIVVPALVLLTERYGFTMAMAIATAAMVAVLIPLALAFGGAPPHHAGDAPSVHSAHAVTVPDWTKARALRSPHFWNVSAPFALVLFSQVAFLVHQIAFLTPTLGRTGAGLAVAVTAAMAMTGRIGLGFAIDRLDQRLASALSFASQAAALIVMTQATAAPVLFAACALYGFSVGNVITFPALIVQREFPAAAFGTLIALSTAIAQFTYAFGPGLVGFARDLTGGYAVPLMICAALNTAAAIIIVMRPRGALTARTSY